MSSFPISNEWRTEVKHLDYRQARNIHNLSDVKKDELKYFYGIQ